MYCLGLSTTNYSVDSAVLIHKADVTFMNFSRRTNRVPTLDGASYIVDSGYSPGDLTLQIRRKPKTREEKQRLEALLKYYQKILASTENGLFLGTIDTIRRDRTSGEMQIDILITERIDGGL